MFEQDPLLRHCLTPPVQLYLVIYLMHILGLDCILDGALRFRVEDRLDDELSMLVVGFLLLHVLLDAVQFLHPLAVDFDVSLALPHQHLQEFLRRGVEVTDCRLGYLHPLHAVGIGLPSDDLAGPVEAGTVPATGLLHFLGQLHLLRLVGDAAQGPSGVD